MIERLDTPFICPSLPHEISGQYKAGTTFIEGLVYFKDKWFLYYGTARIRITFGFLIDGFELFSILWNSRFYGGVGS